MYSIDIGEVVSRCRYIREVYETPKPGEYLLSSKALIETIISFYKDSGNKVRREGEIDVKVKLPYNQNRKFREGWQETTLRGSEDWPLILRLESLVGIITREIVLGTSDWVDYFETQPGEPVLIKPNL
jgi:hypothetical protein